MHVYFKGGGTVARKALLEVLNVWPKLLQRGKYTFKTVSQYQLTKAEITGIFFLLSSMK